MKSISTILLLFSFTFSAQQGIVKEVVSRYQQGTISAEYSVEIYWAVRERTSRRKGTLLFNQNNQYRVELGRYLWVCDGNEVWQYSKRKGMATVYSLDRSPFQSPKDLFSFITSKNFTETLSNDGSRVTASWTSENASDEYQEIVVVAQVKSREIDTIILVEKGGDRYTYTISATNFTATAGPTVFSFTPPQGVEIVEKR